MIILVGILKSANNKLNLKIKPDEFQFTVPAWPLFVLFNLVKKWSQKQERQRNHKEKGVLNVHLLKKKLSWHEIHLNSGRN